MKMMLQWLMLICVMTVVAEPATKANPRFVQKLTLSPTRTVMVAEGDSEARSIGSYSVRLYSTEHAQPGDDTTFFLSGLIHARDGTIEKIETIDLKNAKRKGQKALVVIVRSAGSGGYLSAQAFTFHHDRVALCGKTVDLPADAAVLRAVKVGQC